MRTSTGAYYSRIYKFKLPMHADYEFKELDRTRFGEHIV